MKKWTKVLSAFVVATVMSTGVAAAVGCDGCNGDEEHQHIYTWVDNGDGTHKEHCGVDGCDAPDKSQGNHVDADNNGKCDLCYAAVTPVEKVTVTFVTGEGASAVAPQEIDKGGKATRPATDPVKPEHTFVGWFTEENGTTEFNFDTVINADTSIYAKFIANGEIPPAGKVTVTFVTGEGASAVAPQEIDKGGKVEKPENPTKGDFIFDGWFTDAECKNAFGFDTEIQADTSLYAKWRTAGVFDTLTARADNIISEAFLDKTKEDITVHGSAYGTAGVFVDSEGVYDLSEGALVIGGSTSSKNIGAIVDFGIVSGTVEGYFEFTMGAEASSGGNYNSVNFYNQNSKVLEMMAVGGGNFRFTLNGTLVEAENAVASKKDTLYKVEFKFDLEAKKLTLKINGTTVFNDKDSNIDAVTGCTVMTSNSGKRTNKIDCIAVCGTAVSLEDYKADLTGKLESKLSAMTDATGGTHKINAEAVAAACAAGKTAVSEATGHAAVYVAYNGAVKAMNSIAGDIQQAAIDYIETQFHAADYTVNKTAYDAEIAKIIRETDATKLVVPDETADPAVAAGATLQAVLTAIEAIDNDEGCFYKYLETKGGELMVEFDISDYNINHNAYNAIFEGADVKEYKEYSSYAEAMEAANAALDKIKEDLLALKTDATIIGEYAAGKATEINGYRAEEIAALTDAELKAAISNDKQHAIDTLADGVIGDGKDYDDETSADYYITVIDGKVAAVKESIDDKIAMAGKTMDEVKAEAVAEFNDMVTEELSKVMDEAFAAELKANTEAPALDLSECTTAGAVTTTLDAAKTAYAEWLAGKLAEKEYTITVSGSGVASPVIVKVKYGAGISAADVKDPTADNPNLMVADDKLYTDSAYETEYDETAKIYADGTLYVKTVLAVTFNDVNTFSWKDIKVEGDQIVLGKEHFTGVNAFITPVGQNVVYRNNTDTKVTGVTGGIVRCKAGGEAFTVTFNGTGSLAIGVRGGGNTTDTTFYLKDANGNNIAATYNANAADTKISADGNVYTMQSKTYQVFTFNITESGTYTFCVGTGDCRVASIVMKDNYKEAAIPVTGVTLDKTTAELTVNSEMELVATITPEDTNFVKSVTWSVNEDGAAFASVDQNGIVKGLAAGEATVTVTVTDYNDKTIQASCVITIKEQGATGVDVKDIEYVGVGQTITLVATVFPENASNKEVTWTVTEGTEFASVDENGVVTGLQAGTATVTVTTVDGNHIDTCTVTVSALPEYTGTVVSESTKEVDASSVAKAATLNDADSFHTNYPDSTFIIAATKGGKDTKSNTGGYISFYTDSATSDGSKAGATLTIKSNTDNAKLTIQYSGTSGKRYFVLKKGEDYIGDGLVSSGNTALIAKAVHGDETTITGVYESNAFSGTVKTVTIILPTAGEYVISFYALDGTNKEHKIQKISLTESTETVATKNIVSVTATATIGGTTASTLESLVSEVVLNLEGGTTAKLTEGYTVLLKGDSLVEGENTLVVIYGTEKTLDDATRYNSVELTVTVTATE